MKKLAFCDDATKEAAKVALRAGWQACMSGSSMRSNPNKSGTGDELEQRKFNQWRFGWGEAQSRKHSQAFLSTKEKGNENVR